MDEGIKKASTLFPRVSSFLCKLSVGPADLCHYYKTPWAWSGAFCGHTSILHECKIQYFHHETNCVSVKFIRISSSSPSTRVWRGGASVNSSLPVLYVSQMQYLKLLLPISEVSEYWLIRSSTPTRVGGSWLYHPREKRGQFGSQTSEWVHNADLK